MKEPGEISSLKKTPKGLKLSGKRTGFGQTLESIICTKEAILIRENLSGKKTETGVFFPVSF